MIKAFEDKVLTIQKILIIDDDSLSGNLLRQIIDDEKGYKAAYAQTIPKAMDALDKYYFDYIILDGMERASLEFIIWVSRNHNEMLKNIIAFTGDCYLEREMMNLGLRLNSHKDFRILLEILGIEQVKRNGKQ